MIQSNLGITTIEQTDSRYPWAFRALGDEMPPRIYVYGNIELLRHTKMVAIIGSRKALNRTLDLADEFENDDYVIVSNLSRGCVAAWGRIIAIVATGLDIVLGNTLCTPILKQGGLLLSEQPPGTKATTSHRIACARLQVALANPIVVVQATMKSLVNFSLEQTFYKKYVERICKLSIYDRKHQSRYRLNNRRLHL